MSSIKKAEKKSQVWKQTLNSNNVKTEAFLRLLIFFDMFLTNAYIGK